MSKQEEISGVHNFLRESTLLKPIKLCYAQLLNIKRYGFKYEYQKIKYGFIRRHESKVFYKKIVISEQERQKQKQETYEKTLCFSILVPLYNTPEGFLRDMIESVQKQTYSQWELCLADGSDDEHSDVGKIVKEYADADNRIKYKVLEENGGISENTNACIDMSSGDYIVLFDHDDMLHESALYEIRKAIDDKNADFIYTDEAIFSTDYRKPDSYHLKTDFAIDDLRSNNYICHISCFSRELLEKAGKFRKEFDGSQDFDIILRLTEKAESIVHVPKVLYYWRCHELSVASDISAKTYCIDAGKKAIESHLERVGVKADVKSSEIYPVIYKVTYEIVGKPLVSIIVTKQYDEIDDCVASLKENTLYDNYEIIICENIDKRNHAVQNAKGDYLVFVTDGCRFENNEWLTELLSVVQRSDIGAVGCKISHADTTLRDFGITLGVGITCGLSSNFYGMEYDCQGYMGNMYFTHEVSAMTDCGMMVSKKDFQDAGGFDERLSEWFAGVDLCLKLKNAGKLNAINPYAKIVYVHRKNRDRDMNGCYVGDKECMIIVKEKWKDDISYDEYYNSNLTTKCSNWMIG